MSPATNIATEWARSSRVARMADLADQWIEGDFYQAALDRFELLYKRFDTVAVSISGGKDSSVCLQLALTVAQALNKLPVKAYFWDLEAVHPETIEYLDRVRMRSDIDLKWLTFPIKHRNTCSIKSPYWYSWDPKAEHLWCRMLPLHAIREPKWFRRGMTITEASALIYGREYGTVANVRSMRRLDDSWMSGGRDGHSYAAYPIYDWTLADIYNALRRFPCDYSWIDASALAFGEEPLETVLLYARRWPDLWNKMTHRVPGAAGAAAYVADPSAAANRREWAYRLLALFPDPHTEHLVAIGERPCSSVKLTLNGQGHVTAN